MKKLLCLCSVLLLLITFAACSGEGGDSATPAEAPVATATPTPAPTLEPHPIWGPTPLPTDYPQLPSGTLSIADDFVVDAPYPVLVSKQDESIAFGKETALVDIFLSPDDAVMPHTSYLYAVLTAKDEIFSNQEQIDLAFAEITQQYIGEVEDAVVEELSLETPSGALPLRRILTKVSSAPVDIRLLPYKNSLIIVYGTAINGADIAETEAVLSSLRYSAPN